MGLFSDIYNTVAKFFRPQEEEGEASKSVATNRLKLVLMQDRTNLTPRILEQMRSELIDLLSRYVELDKELLELNFEQEGEQVALMLSIPVIRAKDEEEIEAAIKASKVEIELPEELEDLTEDEEEESDASEEADEDFNDTNEEETEEDIKVDETENMSDEASKKVSTPEEMNSKAEINKEETEEEISK